MLNRPSTNEVKRYPEAKTLLVTGDETSEAMKKALHWLTER